MAQIIYSGTPSSLPHTFNYTPNSDIPVLLHLSGSAWSKTANKKIGLQVEINGLPVATASIYSNGVNTHRALNAGIAEHTFPIKIEGGEIQPVSIAIKALNSDTVFDGNDEVTLGIF